MTLSVKLKFGEYMKENIKSIDLDVPEIKDILECMEAFEILYGRKKVNLKSRFRDLLMGKETHYK